jgi:hypothetical protein
VSASHSLKANDDLSVVKQTGGVRVRVKGLGAHNTPHGMLSMLTPKRGLDCTESAGARKREERSDGGIAGMAGVVYNSSHCGCPVGESNVGGLG